MRRALVEADIDVARPLHADDFELVYVGTSARKRIVTD